MLSTSSYLIAWGFYLLGCVGGVSVVWYLTRNIRREELRNLLLLIVAVLLITPYYADPVQSYLAPALIMCLLEGLFEGPQAMWRTGVPLLVSLFGAMALSLMIELGRCQLLEKRRQAKQQYLAHENERQALLSESRAMSDSAGQADGAETPEAVEPPLSKAGS